MADVLFIAILIGFFTLAALLVRACDRIIGGDVDVSNTGDEDIDAISGERVAA